MADYYKWKRLVSKIDDCYTKAKKYEKMPCTNEYCIDDNSEIFIELVPFGLDINDDYCNGFEPLPMTYDDVLLFKRLEKLHKLKD